MAWLAEAEVAADAAPCARSFGARETAELAGSKALLLARPAGVYTCARLASGPWEAPIKDALVVWRFHLARLAAGLAALGDGRKSSEAAELMQKQTTDMVEHVAALAARGAGAQGDWMVTALWWTRPEDAAAMISVHLCPMPQPRLQGATALVHGDRRSNAGCKHSQWVTDRVPIEQYAREVEAALGTTFQEVILSKAVVDDAGVASDRLLLEGTVSNFFVVRDNAVVTAQADVLHGSTRELVLTACSDLGIPVTFAPPRLSQCETWQAAFVTSAVRLVMEIETLVWEERGSSTPSLRQASFSHDKCDVPQRIREHILAHRMYLSR